jgi:hypothetical protein
MTHQLYLARLTRQPNQMYPARTRWERRSLVDLTFSRRASDPALYVEPRVEVGLDHGGHVAA